MPVQINEIVTTVDVVEPQSVLDPAVLEQVVQAVIAELDRRQQAGRARRPELDLRSVVQQQRDTGGR